MIFALLTLLTALALATVAGWFSIIGIMAILAGAPLHALVAGVTIEVAKLVTTSWIYRNWNFSTWKLRILLMFFTVLIMLVTSMGVFGFLSKAHLEQGASTIDNSAKVERLEQQINREKATIAYSEKTLAQLDATLDSYIGKDRADRSVVIRQRQEPQRKQLKADIAAAQKEINTFSEEKFKLQSEVRKLQLEVGPIRYIAELIYGAENNTDKNIESAVRIFILLLVLTLDPLAVTLLIAANNTFLRRQNEKKKTEKDEGNGQGVADDPDPTSNTWASIDNKYNGDTDTKTSSETIVDVHKETEVHDSISTEDLEITDEGSISEEKMPVLEEFLTGVSSAPKAFVRSPTPTRVTQSELAVPAAEPQKPHVPWAHQESVLREILGATPHFIPKKIYEEEKIAGSETVTANTAQATSGPGQATETVQQNRQEDNENTQALQRNAISAVQPHSDDKYPKALSWLAEFKRT
jgi:outer membrane murein-binding lipoprotein Lpp